MSEKTFGQTMTAKASRLSDKRVLVQPTVPGAMAFTSNGIYATVTKEAISAMEGSGTNGRVAINHEPYEGMIVGPVTIVDGLPQIEVEIPEALADYLVAVGDNEEPPGVSAEFDEITLNDENEIVSAQLSGISFTMAPHKSLCSTKDGCKVLTAAASEEEKKGGINMEDAISIGIDEYKELCAQASELAEAKALITDLETRLATAEQEKTEVSAKASEYAEQLEKFVDEKKKERMEALSSLIGEEAIKAFEGKSLCEIQAAIDVAEYAKVTALASVEIDSGAKTHTEPGSKEAAELEKDLKEFLGVR